MCWTVVMHVQVRLTSFILFLCVKKKKKKKTFASSSLLVIALQMQRQLARRLHHSFITQVLHSYRFDRVFFSFLQNLCSLFIEELVKKNIANCQVVFTQGIAAIFLLSR